MFLRFRTESLVVDSIHEYRVSKNEPFYFWNNSVKSEPVLINFVVHNPEEFILHT